jgi:hypothetical protein
MSDSNRFLRNKNRNRDRKTDSQLVMAVSSRVAGVG